MTVRKYYAIRCETEDQLVYEWNSSEPTECPNDPSHTIGRIRLEKVNESLSPLVHVIVSNNEEDGNYTSISQAFADGNTNIFVKSGTYIEINDIIMPNHGKMIGEAAGMVVIVLAAGNSVIIDGSLGVKETSGTIDATNNNTTVVGNGTTFTNLNPGQYILIGNNYLPIASITNDTSLELTDPYRGKTITSKNYIAQSMLTGVIMENLVLTGSSNIGLICRAGRFCHIHDIALIGNATNIHLMDNGDCGFVAMGIQNSLGGPGIRIENCVDVLFGHCNVYNNAGNGVEVLEGSNNLAFDACSVSTNNGNGYYIDTNSNNITITDGNSKQNNSAGLHFSSSVSNVIASSFCVISNTVGVLMEGDGNTINACNICDNDTGIICNGTGSGSITNCLISNNTANAVELLGDNSICTNNRVKNNGGKGIYVTGDDNNISNNRITANTGNGLELTATAENTIVNVNNLKGNTGVNFVDNGVGTLTSNNITA